MESTQDPVPSGFETNAGSFRRGKPDINPPADRDPGSKDEFRKFLQARQARSQKGNVAVNAPYQPVILPTPERLHKDDRPKRTADGYYRAPAPIERLRNRGLLDPLPRINEAMYSAAQMLQQSFYNAGLSQHIKSQDLSRIGGGGATTAASHMPINEFAAHYRQKFRLACKRMGWYEAYPLRGCGRLVVDVICHEMTIEVAGRKFFPNTRNDTSIASANDRLKEGLFTLAFHWKLI